MIVAVDHLAISTGDVDRLAAFYRDMLGFEDVWAHDIVPDHALGNTILGLNRASARVVMLRHGAVGLELFQFSHPAPAPGDPDRPVVNHGITHICLRVANIEGEYERLSAAGVRFTTTPIELPDGRKATYSRDPDGNVIELLQPAP